MQHRKSRELIAALLPAGVAFNCAALELRSNLKNGLFLNPGESIWVLIDTALDPIRWTKAECG
ncbi:MAG: hypothetical protein JNJ60_18595 [Rhodocyclaceae bacterium]|nr:hypothetical protein [Rhodocyclaceae bacterium]